MSELEALSQEELEDLLVRIRAEIEVRERVPEEAPALASEPAPLSGTLRRRRPRAAAAAEGGEGPAEAEAPAVPTAAVEVAPAVDAVSAEEPGGIAEAPPAEAQAEPEPAAPPEPEPVIKYMHPSNRNFTWSGEGKPPPWVEIWLYTGGTLYALEVAAEKLRPRPRPSFLTTPAAPPAPPPDKPSRFRRRRHQS